MDPGNVRKRLQKQIKQKIQELSKNEIKQALANAVGERRIRDLLDLVIGLEIECGWKITADYLIATQNAQYKIPPITGRISRDIEPLKYREAIFSLFNCKGLEAINIETQDILATLRESSSATSAELAFTKKVEESTSDHLEHSNFLFIEMQSAKSCLPDHIMDKIRQGMRNNISSVGLPHIDDIIDISSLWNTEYGRIALSQLGIRGTKISRQELQMVLSVIPVSQSSLNEIPMKEKRNSLLPPLNQEYHHLLTRIIDHDAEQLANLGSRFAMPTMNYLLVECIARFQKESSPKNYSELTTQLFNHIFLRSVDSLIALERMVKIEDQRIASLAITAFGNYYHESSVGILAQILCHTKSDATKKKVIESLSRIKSKLAEFKSITLNLVETEHRNCKELKRFHKEC